MRGNDRLILLQWIVAIFDIRNCSAAGQKYVPGVRVSYHAQSSCPRLPLKLTPPEIRS